MPAPRLPAGLTQGMTRAQVKHFDALADAIDGLRGAAVADVTAADATDLASAIALANATKATLNSLLAAMRAAETLEE